MPPKRKNSSETAITDTDGTPSVSEKAEPERVKIKIEPNTICEPEIVRVSCALYASFGLLPAQKPIQDPIKEEPIDTQINDLPTCETDSDSEIEILGTFQPFKKQRLIKQEKDYCIKKESVVHKDSEITNEKENSENGIKEELPDTDEEEIVVMTELNMAECRKNSPNNVTSNENDKLLLVTNHAKNEIISNEINIKRENKEPEPNSILNTEGNVSATAVAEFKETESENAEIELTPEEELFSQLEQIDTLHLNYVKNNNFIIKKKVYDAVYTSDIVHDSEERKKIEEELSCLKQLCFTPRKYRSELLEFSDAMSNMHKLFEKYKIRETLQEHNNTALGENQPELTVPGVPNVDIIKSPVTTSVTELTIHGIPNVDKSAAKMLKSAGPLVGNINTELRENLKRKITSFSSNSEVARIYTENEAVKIPIPSHSKGNGYDHEVPHKIPRYHSGPITSNNISDCNYPLQDAFPSGNSEAARIQDTENDARIIPVLSHSRRNGRYLEVINIPSYHSEPITSNDIIENNCSLQDTFPSGNSEAARTQGTKSDASNVINGNCTLQDAANFISSTLSSAVSNPGTFNVPPVNVRRNNNKIVDLRHVLNKNRSVTSVREPKLQSQQTVASNGSTLEPEGFTDLRHHLNSNLSRNQFHESQQSSRKPSSKRHIKYITFSSSD